MLDLGHLETIRCNSLFCENITTTTDSMLLHIFVHICDF